MKLSLNQLKKSSEWLILEAMSSIITLTCLVSLLVFPTLILCFVYPLSKKWSLFWSNFITTYCDRVFFSILKLYKKFNLIEDDNLKNELPGQFLVVSNHQSLLDICVHLHFFGGLRTRFVAKDSLAKVPMVGKMLKSQGHCLIPRKGVLSMKALDSFADRVKASSNWIPVIFPEGTRSRDGSLGKFYSAGFRRLEEQLNLPVVVCALDGGWRISQIDTIFRNLHRGSYQVKILKVFEAPKNKEEEMSILEESRTLIENQLQEWRKD